MEIIAKKSKQANKLTVFSLILGIGLIVAGLILLIWLIASNSFSSDNTTMNIAFIICVVVLIGMGLWIFVKSYIIKKINDRTSDNLIVYDNEKLIFDDGYNCSPEDIIKVEYSKAVARNEDSLLPDVEQNYGYLTIYTTQRNITYNQVADVENAHNKLIYYMKQARGETK